MRAVRPPKPNGNPPNPQPATPMPTEVVGVDGSLDLEELLQCPVCMELREPPIYQCNNGHTICHLCRPQVKLCPVCRQVMPKESRNLALEKLYNSTNFTCTFGDAGCGAVVKGEKFKEHIGQCEYRPFTCDFSNFAGIGGQKVDCTNTKVQRGQLLPHLQNVHGLKKFLPGGYAWHSELLPTAAEIPLALWEFDNHTFLELIAVKEAVVQLRVLVLENKSAVNMDKYEVEIQLIRSGVPLVLKGTYPCLLSHIDEYCMWDNRSLLIQRNEFQLNFARMDKLQTFSWVSRVFFKVKANFVQ